MAKKSSNSFCPGDFSGAAHHTCPHVSHCNTVSGLRAVPGVCDRFVTCYKGAARVQQCPPGTHFCVKSLMCDWPTKAVCDQVVTTHVWI